MALSRNPNGIPGGGKFLSGRHSRDYLADSIVKEVSVIIPTFNRAKKVIRALSSVLNQTFTKYEIIVVDDGSTDGTQECLAQFRHQIRYIRHHKNRGVSAARNTGIKSL